MAAELWANDSGVARQILEVWVNDSGTARQIQEIWVNDSGTARQVFNSGVVAITDQVATSTVAAATATGRYSLANDGGVYKTNGTDATSIVENWLTPAGGVALYECRATITSGTLASGTTGAWLNLATTRSWTVQRAPPPGSNSCTFTLEIRRASDAVVLDTATISVVAASS
jgi:hypothetical protein